MTRFAILFTILLFCLTLMFFQCDNDDDDDESSVDASSDDDLQDDDEADDDDSVDDGPQPECTNERGSILFIESWDKCPDGAIPSRAWQVETEGSGRVEIVSSDDWITEYSAVGKALKLSTSEGSTTDRATIYRTHEPGSEATIEASYWIKFVSGGIFTLGMATKDLSHRTGVILDNTGANPTMYARDMNGNLYSCTQFPINTWFQIGLTVSLDNFFVGIVGTGGHCENVVWQDENNAENIKGFIMSIGADHPATVLVDYMHQTHQESP